MLNRLRMWLILKLLGKTPCVANVDVFTPTEGYGLNVSNPNAIIKVNNIYGRGEHSSNSVIVA